MAEDIFQTREQMLLDLAKPWRNRWRVRIPHGAWSAGDEYWDCDTWPTREIAEEKAREEMAWDAAHGDALIEEWVGAFQTSQGET